MNLLAPDIFLCIPHVHPSRRPWLILAASPGLKYGHGITSPGGGPWVVFFSICCSWLLLVHACMRRGERKRKKNGQHRPKRQPGQRILCR